MAARAPNSLFKYCSVATAKQILTSRCLRWSAPHLLHDPLEMNQDSGLGFNADDLLRAAVQTALGLIFAKDVPAGNAPLLAAIRRWREEERFGSPEEAEDVLYELMAQIVEPRMEAIDKIKTDWQRYTRQLRILCFSTKADNMNNWYNFADNHAGVALRFQHEDSPTIKGPLPVRYQTDRPDITTLKKQLGLVLFNEPHVAQDYFLEKFTIKAAQCSNQQEIRCFYQQDTNNKPVEDDPITWFIDRPFGDDDLKAVYFGLSVNPADRREIYQLVKENYTLVKLFDFKLAAGKYELESAQITEKPC